MGVRQRSNIKIVRHRTGEIPASPKPPMVPVGFDWMWTAPNSNLPNFYLLRGLNQTERDKLVKRVDTLVLSSNPRVGLKSQKAQIDITKALKLEGKIPRLLELVRTPDASGANTFYISMPGIAKRRFFPASLKLAPKPADGDLYWLSVDVDRGLSKSEFLETQRMVNLLLDKLVGA